MQRAYSYIRFSKRDQAAGSSFARQLALTQAYCDRHSLTLDAELTLHDLGVSAFEGKNAKDGALAVFLDAVQFGRVPSGSRLIVESLDRLSRENPMDALDLLKRLLAAGVEIATLQPETLLTRASLNDMGPLFMVLGILFRAHEESATKRSRCRDAWHRKRQEIHSKPATAQCPAWLRLRADRTGYEEKPKAVAAVRRIFSLAREGLGAIQIAKQLAKEKIPPFGGKKNYWCRAYVTKILSNRAVLGECQPYVIREGKRVPEGEPVANHFPVIISEAEFLATRRAVELRLNQRGPWGEHVRNLFTELLFDARDGCPMHVRTKGQGRRIPRLVSAGAVNGREGSAYLSFPYEVVEHLVLTFLDHELAAELIQAEGNGLEGQITDLTSKLTDIKHRKKKAEDRAAKEQDFDTYLGVIKRLAEEEKATAEALEHLRQQQTSNHAATLGEARGVLELLRAAPPEEQKGLRLRLKARVRSLIREIWVLVEGQRGKRWATIQLFLYSGNALLILGFNPGIWQDPVGFYYPEDQLAPKDDLRQWRQLEAKPTFGPPRGNVLTAGGRKLIQEFLERCRSGEASEGAT
jgi:DNA invertase Pin-like site-specific DNA recombinase